MGRNIPVGDQNPTIIIIHTFFSTIFFITSITATIAVISSLCGTFYRRKIKTSPPPENDTKENKNPNSLSPENLTTATPPASELDDKIDIESSQQPLPPPPGKRHLSGAASYHVRSDSSLSKATMTRTNIESSRSMRVLGNGLASLRRGSKREDKDERKKKNLKHEDSIWKKTIILGDKCKVPDEDDDTIIYDEKGNRISTYHHRKNANSMALSRQGSAFDLDAVPKKDDSFHDHETRNTIEVEV